MLDTESGGWSFVWVRNNYVWICCNSSILCSRVIETSLDIDIVVLALIFRFNFLFHFQLLQINSIPGYVRMMFKYWSVLICWIRVENVTELERSLPMKNSMVDIRFHMTLPWLDWKHHFNSMIKWNRSDIRTK